MGKIENPLAGTKQVKTAEVWVKSVPGELEKIFFDRGSVGSSALIVL